MWVHQGALGHGPRVVGVIAVNTETSSATIGARERCKGMRLFTAFLTALLAVLVVALGLAAGPASAQVDDPGPPGAGTVDELDRPSALREYRGFSVYSSFDAASERYGLTVRGPDGEVISVPVEPQAEPFDVDIGPDSAGRPALALSLCDRPGGDGRSGGCDVFVHTLERDTDLRPVTNANTDDDEIRPTIWRGTLAFVRLFEGREAPVVYSKPIIAPRERPSTRQPGVPTQRCEALFEGGSCTTTNRRVNALELWGDNLALIVAYSVPDGLGVGGQNEVRVNDIEDRSARQVAYQVRGLGGQTLVGPSFTEGRLAWYKSCFGDPGGCFDNAGAFRFQLSNGAYSRDLDRTVLTGFAWTGRGSRRIEADGENRCSPANGPTRTCPVILADEPEWTPIDAQRAR